MKAVIINQFGNPNVLEYTDMDLPPLTPERLLIKVHASSINPVDWKIRKGMLKILMGRKFPIRLGSDFSGVVMAVGERVTGFQIGDEVYGFLNPTVGGTYGDYVTASPECLCLKPRNLTHLQAAAVPLAASTALQALQNQGKIKKGQKILINGASGGVGTFAVQIAKVWETEVTAVCSTKNIPLVQRLGTDDVIDYTHEDFTTTGQQYDIIFDVVSNRSFTDCKKSLLPGGVYITLLPSLDLVFKSFLNLFSRKKIKFVLANSNSQDLQMLKGWIEQGKITPIIDRTYPLSEIALAHTYSEEGHAVGKIVITIDNESSS